MTRLWVSPHLDDVALSCGGELQQALGRGERVVVASVFTAGGPTAAARRAEDRAALNALGCEVVHLGFPDAPFRPGLERSYRSLVLDSEVDAALVAQIAAAVLCLADEIDAREIGLPLGVGRHIDHRTTHAVWRAMKRPVCFYEDRPYAFAEVLVDLRLAELGAGPAPVPDRLARSLREAFEAQPFLRAYAGDRQERQVPEAQRLRAAAIAGHLRCAAVAPDPAVALGVSPHPTSFSAAVLARAAALVAAYDSQVVDLFGGRDPETIARAYVTASVRQAPRGAFVERLWRR